MSEWKKEYFVEYCLGKKRKKNSRATSPFIISLSVKDSNSSENCSEEFFIDIHLNTGSRDSALDLKACKNTVMKSVIMHKPANIFSYMLS